MYLLNDHRQWIEEPAEDAKGELNVPTQNSIFSHLNNIKHCTIQDSCNQTGNRMFLSTCFAITTSILYNHDMLLAKTYSKNTSLSDLI